VRIALAPHAIYTVCQSALKDVVKVSEELQMPLHIHCSETEREVAECRKEHNGLTPVEYLDSVGMLREGTFLAHCVHLTDNDRKIIAARQAVICHCPVSNMKLCSGMFDFVSALQAGCRVTIGTDGASSNNNLSMLEEMKFAALSAKRQSHNPEVGKDIDIFKAATSSGAKAFGIDGGEIAVGKAADFLLVDLEHPLMMANHNFISNMVYSADSGCIDTVVCGGEILMLHKFIEGEKEILQEARECCRRLQNY
jgi:5-methylthioadenosine/S-adenosylhomocysteine deaminase